MKYTVTNSQQYCVFLDCGCTRVLTFDDIPNAGNIHLTTIPNGYGGFDWTNAYYLNTTWERVTYGWNGYATGRNSGIFVALNANGQQMAMNVPVGQYFQLNSAVLAAAWNNNLMVTIQGTRANVLIYQTVVSLQVASKTTLYMLKWSGIDKITFNSTGGTPYPGLGGVGTEFVLDDVDISI